MHKVLILFGNSQWKKSKPFNNDRYMFSYEYFYGLCRQHGIQMYRASYQWYDYRKKMFRHAWSFEQSGGRWKRVNDIVPDLVYDKTKARPEVYAKTDIIEGNHSFFNNLEFTKIIDNKLNVGLLFEQWSKKNYVVNRIGDLAKALKQIKTRKAVLKPLFLSGGEGVIIGEKNELLKLAGKNHPDLRNWVVQEYVDSSRGIPGVMTGTHDLRLVLVDDKIVYAYYRCPAPGKLLANLAQGGSMTIVPLDKIPTATGPIVAHAQKIFAAFPHKIYTIDIMFDEVGRPWVVELNSMPGMYFEPGQEKTRKVFYSALLKSFKAQLKK